MKFGRNYDTEIMELNKKTDVLSEENKDNKNEIIAFGQDFANFKANFKEEMNGFLEQYKIMAKEHSEMKKLIEDFKNDHKQESNIKAETPDIMTCSDICTELTDVKNLNPTCLKYYLYELKLLVLNINKYHNTYKAVSNYKEICTEISKFMYVKGRVITFDKEVMDYFKQHTKELRDSIARYLRKNNQYSKSKDKIDALQVKNYEDEIKNICGIGSNFDKSKWSKIYDIYKKSHPNFWNEHKKYADNYIIEHQNEKRPTVVSYLVNQCNDGDVLLRIACELFVD